MQLFTNDNKELQELPRMEEINLHPLKKSFLSAQIISTCIFYLIPLIGCVVLYFLQPAEVSENIPPFLLEFVSGLILTIMAVAILFKILGFRHKAYGIREKDILYKSGLAWRTETIVPFNRIQHVELGQGPLERYFGISRIRVFTAGGSQSDLVIPGLETEDAQRIKTFLVNKTKRDGI